MADTKIEAETKAAVEIKSVLNIRNVTTIANSVNEFNIYSYKSTTDTNEDIKRVGFFNPGCHIFEVGDVIRVFQYGANKKLVKYYEFVVMSIDKDLRTVSVAIINEKNLEKNIIE